MKLAHFSDVHVTRFPLAGGFALKRLAAVASYTLAGRGRHFEGSDERIAKLLAHVDAQQVDHALCTGDLTGVASDEELARAAELFGPRLEQPERHSVIPGNHDRYVDSARGAFERHFARLCEGARFPAVKALPGGVTLVLLDVARPTGLVDSSGLVGEAQRSALLSLLTDASLRQRFVVVALHYGLLRMNGQRDARSHGLRDDVELMHLLDRDDVTVDLVLHGHLHRPFTLRTKRRHVVNAGSATDLHLRCGYNVYDIDPGAHRVGVTRFTWSPGALDYQPDPSHPLNTTLVTR
ncbi:MAG: metallophosphoesterase [Myxococcaceae bacterium]|nr:metallophosphoesterase [Myxococcaceae bacterium]MCA3011781.1 metallophosphoesterase [Myxococcaceae bacterium]